MDQDIVGNAGKLEISTSHQRLTRMGIATGSSAVLAILDIAAVPSRVGEGLGEPGRAFGVKPGFAGKDMPCRQR